MTGSTQLGQDKVVTQSSLDIQGRFINNSMSFKDSIILRISLGMLLFCITIPDCLVWRNWEDQYYFEVFQITRGLTACLVLVLRYKYL